MSADNKEMRGIYVGQPGDYYVKQADNNGIRPWLLKKRRDIVYRLVKKYYSSGAVLDIGCGNSLWNKDSVTTVGLDICEAMLRYNSNRTAGSFFIESDISTGLPIKSDSVNTVVITEVLEHIQPHVFLIEEIRRVLKKGGIVIASVPYDKLPGVWGLIFPIWCRYKGWRDNDPYYSNGCGHTVNFNIKKLKQAFNEFALLELINFNFLTIFYVARKE
jgi:SAM-dependent methyltransferase